MKAKTPTAFLSSTYDDLRAHRAWAIESLRRVGISVSGMDSLGARPVGALESIRDQIGSCDLFVILMAFRRGLIPEGETSSQIELEYEAAVRADLPVLAFLLDEQAPWPRKFDELDTDPGVRRFREHLRERHPSAFFGLDPESVHLIEAVRSWLSESSTDSERQERERARALIHDLADYTSTDELTTKLRRVESHVDDALIEAAPELVPSMVASYREALDWDGLISFVERLEPTAENDPDVVTEYGMALLRKGDLPRAAEVIGEVTAAHPEDAQSWVLFGQLLSRLGDLSRASESYERALVLDPGNLYVGSALARLMVKRGDNREDVRKFATDVRSHSQREIVDPSAIREFWAVEAELELALLSEDWDLSEELAKILGSSRATSFERETAARGVRELVRFAPARVQSRIDESLGGPPMEHQDA